MKNHITLRRPSPSEAAAATAQSAETEFIELRKPLYDFLIAQLHDDALVSQYVSDKIATEIIRISKLRTGTGGYGWKCITSEMRQASAASRWENWRKTHNRTKGDGQSDTVRVRVFDEAHKKFIALSDNRLSRVAFAGEIVACAVSNTDDVLEMKSYCQLHKGKPPKFITLPRAASQDAQAFAAREKLPFSKIISFVLEQY